MRLINNVLASAVLIYKYTIDRITNPISFFKVFENIDKAFREYWQGFLFESKKISGIVLFYPCARYFSSFLSAYVSADSPVITLILMYATSLMQISHPDILSGFPDFHHCTADLPHAYNYEKA